MIDNPAIYTTPGDDRLEAAERRITELEAENAKLLAEVERLRKAGEQLLLLIEHETDLPQGAANGVTDNSGALDEGVCLASDIIEEMRAALRGESEGI